MVQSASPEERRLRQVIDATPVALLLLDAAGRVTLVNAEAERLFGHGRDGLLGRASDDLFSEGLPPGPRRYGVRADGSEVPVETRLSRLETDEGTFELVAIFERTDRIEAGVLPDGPDDSLLLATALQRTLDREGLSVVYQPQVDLTTGTVVGMEALARWDSPELGSVGPDRFIPVAEEGGLIRPLGEWVLRRACVDALGIQALLGRPLGLAVNVSPRQFHTPDWLAAVDAIIAETGFDPTLLELEITEGILMDGREDVIAQLHAFRARGIRIVVDDFGTGYSSLSYLTRFPIDKIKIDRSFVRELTHADAQAAIVDTIIVMAHSLGMGVVAEGVETRNQERYLQRRACDGAQGFRYGPGVPADRFASVARTVVAI
jgi:EAL domain-containing protein (putative c-di-GMP-specific phosphodiesterase class I)